MASAHLENSFGIFSGKYLFTKLGANHATNHTPNVTCKRKIELMRKIVTIILMLVSINIIGQNLAECGIDNNPKLTQTESEFLTEYMNDEQLKNFDLSNKKVIFVTGNSALQFGTKSEYFDQIKEWNENGNKIATWVVELNENERTISGGYDVIITYWVKVLTKKRKKKIISGIKASR